jgi:hypothetical protein
MLLTHGAPPYSPRTARSSLTPSSTGLRVELRSGHNKATVALANRLARIAWRVWRDQRAYQPSPTTGNA